jgi:hypothetical protein
MSFSTYADLKSQIADYLARNDLTSNIPDFITLFEAVAVRRLRVRPMETSTNLTPSSGSVALPSDYLSWRRVTWTGSNRVDLEYVHPSILQAYYPTSPSDTPAMFTIEGSTLKVRPVDATALEFDYLAKTGALSSALQWLYTNHFDLYLSGSLAEAYRFCKNYDQAPVWEQKRDQIFSEITLANFREQGHLVIRPMAYTP